ncbi:hypothetical protein BC829DRAFT_81531 [Chytridium lagenaria]|nr:hypothetical protein BC829DRAFT_81531 [Chytridium lagenaria]
MSSKMKDNPDYEPEDLDDIDDDTENDDAGPSSAARPSSGPTPKTSSNVMKLGQNPFGVPPGDASSKKSTTTVPQVRPTIQESKKMPRAPQPMPPIRSDAFLNAHQYTREKMRVLDVQQNFMLHEVYRFVHEGIYYVDVILKFVADHRMTVNIINNGTHLEYKIFPRDPECPRFHGHFFPTILFLVSTRLWSPTSLKNCIRQQMRSTPTLSHYPNQWKPPLFKSDKFIARFSHLLGRTRRTHQIPPKEICRNTDLSTPNPKHLPST